MTDLVRKSPSDIGKTDNPSSVTKKDGKLSYKQSSFRQRIADSQKATSRLPNRIVLMLDCSGSMQEHEKANLRKIDLLNDAVKNFVQRTNFSDTAIAIETFPSEIQVPLTNNLSQLMVLNFSAGGGTPLHEAMVKTLDNHPLTRGIVVSDGDATDWSGFGVNYDEKSSNPDDILNQYKSVSIPVDTVHIGSSSSGEELLRKIAERTGGIYLKFTDVSAFSRAFSYLTPGLRGMLTDGSVSAQSLGAQEVKR